MQLEHTTKHLKQIFLLSEKIKSDLNWLKESDEPAFVVVADTDLSRYYKYVEVTSLFM